MTEKIKDAYATQLERASTYGRYENQAKCVGSIIKACVVCSEAEGQTMKEEVAGSIAYMAVKLARYAVNPTHYDTTFDMTIYASLIHELHQDDKII